MQQIRIHRSRVRREYPGYEAHAPHPRDPGVVRAKALARAGRTTARQPRPRRPAETAN